MTWLLKTNLMTAFVILIALGITHAWTAFAWHAKGVAAEKARIATVMEKAESDIGREVKKVEARHEKEMRKIRKTPDSGYGVGPLQSDYLDGLCARIRGCE